MYKYGSILLQCQSGGSNKQYLVSFDEAPASGVVALWARYGPTGKLGANRIIESEPTFFNKKARSLIMSKLNKGYVVVEVNDNGYSGTDAGAIGLFLASQHGKKEAVIEPAEICQPFIPSEFIFKEGITSPIW